MFFSFFMMLLSFKIGFSFSFKYFIIMLLFSNMKVLLSIFFKKIRKKCFVIKLFNKMLIKKLIYIVLFYEFVFLEKNFKLFIICIFYIKFYYNFKRKLFIIKIVYCDY